MHLYFSYDLITKHCILPEIIKYRDHNKTKQCQLVCSYIYVILLHWLIINILKHHINESVIIQRWGQPRVKSDSTLVRLKMDFGRYMQI